MVTQRAFSYYQARKKHKERGDMFILNEIAKLKGFKGGKIGERKIDPIEQYAEYLVREMGFRGMKKGEKIDNKVVDADVSPFEEYKIWLRKRVDKKQEELERSAKRAELEGRLEEAKRLKDEAGRIGMPKNIYASLIPEDEYVKSMETLRNRWLTEHQKFIGFCSELEKDIRSWFERNRKGEALLSLEDAFSAMSEYHGSHPGAMNIFSTDDLLIGLGYCLGGKGIDVMTRKTMLKDENKFRTFIVFEQL